MKKYYEILMEKVLLKTGRSVKSTRQKKKELDTTTTDKRVEVVVNPIDNSMGSLFVNG